MSYSMLEAQIRTLPEDCLEEVSQYIEFVLFRISKAKTKQGNNDLGDFFGSIMSLPDGLEFQREVRDEWD